MAFSSILFKKKKELLEERPLKEPEFFTDLNLNQIVEAVIAGREYYNLKNFFYIPLNNIEEIEYRQEIMRELKENEILFKIIKEFSKKIGEMRRYLELSKKLKYKYNKEGWFLEAVNIYCDAVKELCDELLSIYLKSKGFISFRQYLLEYIISPGFTSLLSETKKLKSELSGVKYSLLININSVTVCKYTGETDYSTEIESSFSRFKQREVKDYTQKYNSSTDINRIEAEILNRVAKLFPKIFSSLSNYCVNNRKYPDEKILIFEREIQFYIAWLEYTEKFKSAGLKMCYPVVSENSKEVYGYEVFDLALAGNLIDRNSGIVCNDFHLKDKERIFLVSGPNQGGKTTFARTFGQMHYLSKLGCSIPGRKAQMFLFDRIFTHFEKKEDIKNLRGKLNDDLVRIKEILDKSTPESIIIMNEIFNSTTAKDAIFLSVKILEEIIKKDSLCVVVTFIVELSSMSDKIVSMVATVDSKNPSVRTYKIERRQADGISYAISIAEKYHLTYEQLKKRLEERLN